MPNRCLLSVIKVVQPPFFHGIIAHKRMSLGRSSSLEDLVIMQKFGLGKIILVENRIRFSVEVRIID